MQRHPLLWLGAAAALGAAAIECGADMRALVFGGLAAFCVFVTRYVEGARIRAALSAALAAGALSAAVRPPAVAFRPHTERVTCTVLDPTFETADGSGFGCALDSGATIEVLTAQPALHAGTRILVRGRLQPFDGPRNPGEPDMATIERERGLSSQMSGAHVLRILPPRTATVAIAIARAHAWAYDQFRARLPEQQASILAGELWGARGSLSPDLRAQFQETGTVHLLVTAGLHLGVVAWLALLLLRSATAPRSLTCIAAIGIVWIYAVFSGMHLPAIRAATMLSFALGAHAFGRSARSWSAYGAALLAIVLCNPSAVTSASFVLSFACVGAILLCAEPISEALQSVLHMPERVRETLTLSLATQLGTWPVTAAIFLLFSPYAVAANFAIVPCAGATMILGMAQLLCFPLPLFAQALANLNDWILGWMIGVVEVVAGLPAGSIPMTPAPAWAIAGYAAALVAAVGAWRAKAKTAAAAFIFAGVILVLAPPVDPDRRLRITVLDVGQADGIVLQTPHGHTLLVDAGGKLEQGRGADSSAERVGQRIVVPFLRRSGVRRIDVMILSHPHGDHAGGMAPVLRAFGVSEFADSGQQYSGYAYRDAIQTARTERVPIVYPRAGMVWQTDEGVTLTFVGPSLPFIESDNMINDNSIAFILQYGHFRMLFTGDAGVAAEQRFLHEGIDLHADVLKVGHHGSAYSSSPAFIAAVHPRYAIISVGRHNMFGHPAPSTLETLERFGARTYRTDQNAAVSIVSDGTNVAISPVLP